MKKWVLKAIVQKGISYFPLSHKVNFLFQKYITKGVQLTDPYFEDRLIHAKKHMQYFEKYGSNAPKSMVELGTGWYPIVPLYFYLHGFDDINSIDLNPLISISRTKDTIDFFEKWMESGKLNAYLTNSFSKSRWDKMLQVRSSKNPLRSLRIKVTTGDARQTKYKKDTIGLVTSNNTFEHIYPNILEGILKEFERIRHPQGLQSHFIDMSDHFAHLDASITIYNFLKYSPSAWNRIDNSVQPQNRWRMSQYIELYKKVGMKVIDQDFREGNLSEIEDLNIHKCYSKFSKEDLAISHCYTVSQ